VLLLLVDFLSGLDADVQLRDLYIDQTELAGRLVAVQVHLILHIFQLTLELLQAVENEPFALQAASHIHDR